MSHTIKHILLPFLLLLAFFGGHDATAIPVQAGGLVQQEEGVAQGELFSWPGALPEPARLHTTQATPATAHKKQSQPHFCISAFAFEHWLQLGMARRAVFNRLCQVGLTGIRIIFPFHCFW